MKIVIKIGVGMGQCHKWGQKIKSCGFRLTVPRETIISILSKTDKHLSADEIYMQAHTENPDIGLTTVYRTMDLLEQTGIVIKFDFGHGKAKFELTDEYGDKKHHHHLLCTKCRKVIDYADFQKEELEYIKKVESGLKRKYGFEINAHMINFYGICPDCKKS
jgi:Fur family transcriptional regulator, ferric uptake regulator